jgi:hypothetical protein
LVLTPDSANDAGDFCDGLTEDDTRIGQSDFYVGIEIPEVMENAVELKLLTSHDDVLS